MEDKYPINWPPFMEFAEPDKNEFKYFDFPNGIHLGSPGTFTSPNGTRYDIKIRENSYGGMYIDLPGWYSNSKYYTSFGWDAGALHIKTGVDLRYENPEFHSIEELKKVLHIIEDESPCFKNETTGATVGTVKITVKTTDDLNEDVATRDNKSLDINRIPVHTFNLDLNFKL